LFEEGAGEELTVGVVVLRLRSDRDEVVGVAEGDEIGTIDDSTMGEDDREALVEISPIVEFVNGLWPETVNYFFFM
jgi:hypothetical protein